MKLYWLIISVVCVLQVAGQQDSTARTTTTSAPPTTTTSTRIPSTTTAPSPSTTTSSPPTTTTTSLLPTTTTTSSIPPTTTTSSSLPTTTTRTSTTSSTPISSTSTSSQLASSSQLSSTTSAPSATSSTPTFGNHDTGTSLSGGSIAGIVVGCVVGLALLGFLAFCCISKRRKHVQDEDYLRTTNYSDDPPTEMKQQIGDAPVAGFSPAAAYRQQYSMYPQPEDEWAQQDFTRQRSMRYTTSPYGQQKYEEESPFETPHMHEGQYIGHPSDRYEDPSSYHNPNTPTRETFASSHGAGAAAGASAAGLAAMAYSHNQQHQYDGQDQHDGRGQYDDQGQYDQYTAGAAGDDLEAHNDQYEGEATSSPQHRPDEARSSSPQRDEPQSLPPPHGLGNRWDLYNYAYTPPSTSPNLGPKK